MKVGDRVRTTKDYKKNVRQRGFSGVVAVVEHRKETSSPLITVDVGCGQQEVVDRTWLKYDCSCNCHCHSHNDCCC